MDQRPNMRTRYSYARPALASWMPSAHIMNFYVSYYGSSQIQLIFRSLDTVPAACYNAENRTQLPPGSVLHPFHQAIEGVGTGRFLRS